MEIFVADVFTHVSPREQRQNTKRIIVDIGEEDHFQSSRIATTKEGQEYIVGLPGTTGIEEIGIIIDRWSLDQVVEGLELGLRKWGIKNFDVQAMCDNFRQDASKNPSRVVK